MKIKPRIFFQGGFWRVDPAPRERPWGEFHNRWNKAHGFCNKRNRRAHWESKGRLKRKPHIFKEQESGRWRIKPCDAQTGPEREANESAAFYVSMKNGLLTRQRIGDKVASALPNRRKRK